MKLIKVYVDDGFKTQVDEKAKKSKMNTSSYAGALIKHGMEIVQDGQLAESDTPHTNSPIKVTFNRQDTDQIKKRCDELDLTPEQYINRLMKEEGNPVVVSPFLEDYKNDMERIEGQIDAICYSISQNEHPMVSDDVLQGLYEKLDELGLLFAAIYKRCTKEEDLAINKNKKGRR